MQVMRLILSGQLEPKNAGLLLYALQTASTNLSRINFEPTVRTRVVIDPRTVDQTPLGEDPWRREDFEEEEDDQEAAEQVEAKSEDFGEDKEWTAEVTIPDIEAQAEAGQEDEQTIAQIQAVANSVIRPLRPRSPARPLPGGLSHADQDSIECTRVTQHSSFRAEAKDSRAVRGQILAGQFRFAGTTSTVPASLPPPSPLLSESTYDGRS